MVARSTFALVLAACRGPAASPPAQGPTPLEQAIAYDLSARVGAPVAAHCGSIAGVPLVCHARLPDGEVKIRVTSAGGAWEWHVDDRIDTAPVQAYVEGVLGDLGIAQTVRCPALPRQRRITCPLSGGGVALVEVAAGGQLSLELELDPAAANARTSASADRDLARMSHALERLEDDDEGDEPPGDGGVAQP